MTLHDVMIGVLSGCVLIVFGLVPGLFQGLTEGVRNLLNSVSSPLPTKPRRDKSYDRPISLAGIGATLIVLSVLAYLSN